MEIRQEHQNTYGSFEDKLVASVEVQIKRFVENLVGKVAQKKLFIVNFDVNTCDGVLAVFDAGRLKTSLGNVEWIFYGLLIPRMNEKIGID